VLIWAKSGPTLAVGSYRGNLMIYNHKTAKRVPVIGTSFLIYVYVLPTHLFLLLALFSVISISDLLYIFILTESPFLFISGILDEGYFF
jgi:hypothetical protein